MKPKLRLDYLTTFIEVVERGSLLATSKALNVSISTVSMQVSAVEEYFGAKLIERTPTGINLTEEGKLVYQRTLELLNELDEIQKDIERINNQHFVMAAGCAPGVSIIPPILDEVKKLNPNIKLSTKIKAASTCIELLLKGKADMAIVGYVSDDIQNYGYRVVTLGEDKLVLVIPAEHPLVAKKEVTLKDTIPLPMITLGEGFGITNVLNEELGNRGYSPNDLTIVSEADSIYSQLHSVFSGIGVAITSLMAAKDMEESGLVRIKEISDFRVRRPIYLIYRSELEQKQDIASILELIKKRARELITMKTTSK